MEPGTQLKLPVDEALVLFEWLTQRRLRDDLVFDDQAEQRALWNLEASLEGVLEVTFAPDYRRRLEQARANVRD